MALKFSDYFKQIPLPTDKKLIRVSDKNWKDLKQISPLSKVNLFIGPNNSGKSRLIRELIKTQIVPIFPDEAIEKLKGIVNTSKNKIIKYVVGLAASNKVPLTTNFSRFVFVAMSNSRSLSKETLSDSFWESIFNDLSKPDFDLDKIVQNVESELDYIKQNFFIPYQSLSVPHHTVDLSSTMNPYRYGQLLEIIQDLFNEFSSLQFNFTYRRIYVPALRTLRNFGTDLRIADKLEREYQLSYTIDEVTRNQINERCHCYKSVEIITGEDFYKSIPALKLNETEGQRRIEEFEKFLSEFFFEGGKVYLTSFQKHPFEIHIKIGDEMQQPIYNLGDALQMLIALTIPLFLYDSGIIAIEEPELFMHPGFQKKLMEVFCKHEKSGNFLFLIASHSNHIIDGLQFSDEVSIFTVNKKIDPQDKAKEKLPVLEVENIAFKDKTALNLLGVSNSSVYLSNCTIWVEGVTDRMYLTKMIDCYLEKHRDDLAKFKDLKEGVHYSFVFSCGSNIVHWNFDDEAEYGDNGNRVIVVQLCGKAMVIVDHDFGTKQSRIDRLQKELGVRLNVLPVPEIENLLSYSVIVKTIKSYSTLNSLDESKFVEPSAEDFVKFRLGSLIENIILQKLPTSNRKRFISKSIKSDNQTVQDKPNFCYQAVKNISSENLTSFAVGVIQKIVEFILTQNKIH